MPRTDEDHHLETRDDPGRRRRRDRVRLLPFLSVLLLAGCGHAVLEPGSGGQGGGEGGRSLELTGYLFRTAGETRICDAIAESYPPQCGGRWYRVTGLDFAGVDGLQEAQGVTWTERPVTLKGVLSEDGRTLMVSPNPALGGGPPPPTTAEQPGSAPG